MAKKSIGILQAALRLEASQFKKELKGAEGGWMNFAKKFAIPAATVTALAVGLKKTFDALAETFAFVAEEMNKIEDMGRMADRLGIAIEDFSALSVAMNTAGVDANTFGTAMQRMQRKIGDALRGNKEALAQFEALGLDPAWMRDQSFLRNMQAIADATRTLTSEQEQLSAVVKLFDSEGAKLQQFFVDTNGQVELQAQLYKELGIAMGQDGYEAAKKFNGQLTLINDSWTAFKRELALALVPFTDFEDAGLQVAIMLRDIAASLELIFAAVKGLSGMGGRVFGYAFERYQKDLEAQSDAMRMRLELRESVRQDEARRAGLPVPEGGMSYEEIVRKYAQQQEERDNRQLSIQSQMLEALLRNTGRNMGIGW